MARKISCINENNLQLDFTDKFSPWLLEDCEGIYEVTSKVYTSENTMTDGSTYQGSTTSMRNIILTLRDRPEADHAKNRKELYNLFKAKSPGKFIYYEGDGSAAKVIDYYVESVIIDSAPRSRRATVSLVCPNPFFVDPQDIVVTMSGWVPQFEWQHEFPAAGEEFGYKVAEQIKTIENESGAEHIGITITVEASGTASGFVMTHVEQGLHLAIGTDEDPFVLSAGDKIEITTHTNNKHAYLISGGVRTDINEYLTEDSEFLQIMSGDNTFGYDADVGVEYLSVSITFKYRYPGV